MISTIIIITCILLALGTLVATRSNAYTSTANGNKKINTKWFFTPLAIFIVGLLIAAFQPYSLERVDAGHVGIKVNLTGDARGVSDYTYKTGWVAYNTWTENLYEFPTFQQHIDYDAQQVITKGGFSSEIKPSFNYSLKADAVGDMFVNLRLDISKIEQGWLKTAIVGSVNDVANKWAVDSIFNNRERFESSIVIECNKRLSKWFIVSQLRTNIIPPPSLQASIEAKTKALQEVQVAENQRQVAIADAQRKIAIAKGDSAQAVITAAGKAEAIKREQLQLTPLYIEYLKVTTWDGKMPTTVVGNPSGTMINLK